MYELGPIKRDAQLSRDHINWVPFYFEWVYSITLHNFNTLAVNNVKKINIACATNVQDCCKRESVTNSVHTHLFWVGELKSLLIEGCKQGIREIHGEVILHQLIHHGVHGSLLCWSSLCHTLQQQ